MIYYQSLRQKLSHLSINHVGFCACDLNVIDKQVNNLVHCMTRSCPDMSKYIHLFPENRNRKFTLMSNSLIIIKINVYEIPWNVELK